VWRYPVFQTLSVYKGFKFLEDEIGEHQVLDQLKSLSFNLLSSSK
jgi:hypothetical protein